MRHSSRSSAGFTLIELMVVVAIMAILAGILFPVFSKARQNGYRTTCLSNQRQLAAAIIIYAHDRDVFPSRNWQSEIDVPGGTRLLKCPNVDEDMKINGIGMNAYLHGLRQDAVQRQQDLVLTCDSLSTSTISADHQRHQGFAIYSFADGHAKYSKTPIGRFAAGKFPLNPMILAGTTEVPVVPEHFTEYAANTPIAKEFLVCGPYGSTDETLAVTVPGDLLTYDYVGENELAKLPADDIPLPGEIAPRMEEIKLHPTDTAGNLITKWQYGATGPWSPTSGSAQDTVKMELAENYGAQFYKRTTYAMLFVYSEESRNTEISFLIDDVGVIWLNGTEIYRDPVAEDLNAEIARNKVTKVLPKGINYFLFRCTNWTDGGMKFNIKFSEPVSASGTI